MLRRRNGGKANENNDTCEMGREECAKVGEEVLATFASGKLEQRNSQVRVEGKATGKARG